MKTGWMFGAYRVLDTIGEGGRGEVHRARSKEAQRTRARARGLVDLDARLKGPS